MTMHGETSNEQNRSTGSDKDTEKSIWKWLKWKGWISSELRLYGRQS